MIGRSVSLLLFSTLAIVGVAACGTPTGDPPSTDGDEASTSDGGEVESGTSESETDGSTGTDTAIDTDTGTDSTGTDTAETPLLPDGRGNYVVSMFGGASTTTRWSIVRTLVLSPVDATHGTVGSESWAWHQDTFTGDAHVNKVETGYTTAGGPYVGAIKTPLGFQPGSPGTPLQGEYVLDESLLTITWQSGKWDSWELSTPLSHPTTMITLVDSNYEARHGWGFGSRAPLDTGATMSEVLATPNLSFQHLWGNRYDAPDHENLSYFPLSNYLQCSPVAIMVDEPAPLVCDRWHSYVAGDPSVDGRRNFWNQQLGEVGCAEAGHPCPDPSCNQTTIGELGGHTLAMLQVLDDDGVFRGWVATEASLHGHYSGGALVAASYWLEP